MDPAEEHEHEGRWQRSRHQHHFLTGVLVLVVIVMAGFAWYAYPMLKQRNASLDQLRDQLRDQIRQAQATADDTSSQQNSLRSDAEKLGRDVRARIDALGRRASQAADAAYTRLEQRFDAEVKSRTQSVANLTDRVSNLEASRTADQTQIAQLQQDLTQMRQQASVLDQERQRASQQVEQQSNELAQVRRDVEETRAGSTEQLAALKRDQDRDRREVAGISNKLAVEKIPFEAGTDHTSELTDGISLHVSGTDVAYRRVSGWMWVASEHRNIWLRSQSALEPVTFYGSQDGQKRELVITNVTKNSVTGYLLLPKQTARTASAPAASGGGE
jgi:hypothetical protein